MTALATPTLAPSIRTVSAEEFEQMPDTRGLELDDGVLVELNVGTESAWVAGELHRRLANFVVENKRGWAFPPETPFLCFADHPNRLRKPDGAFVRSGRLPGGRLPLGFTRIVPDLVVEVVSPNDTAAAVERKVREYRSVKVPLLWVLYPETQTARVYRPGQPSDDLSADDHLDGGTVVLGFRVRLGDVMPPPETQASTPE